MFELLAGLVIATALFLISVAIFKVAEVLEKTNDLKEAELRASGIKLD